MRRLKEMLGSNVEPIGTKNPTTPRQYPKFEAASSAIISRKVRKYQTKRREAGK
jgi:hypothetical protein